MHERISYAKSFHFELDVTRLLLFANYSERTQVEIDVYNLPKPKDSTALRTGNETLDIYLKQNLGVTQLWHSGKQTGKVEWTDKHAVTMVGQTLPTAQKHR